MAKAAKKAAKKVSKKSSGDHVARRETVVRMLLRKNGTTLAELVEAGHNQPAQAALKIAETRGLKTSSKKEEGEVTRYFATGTPLPAGTRKAPVKKAVKKAAPKKKAAKRAKKPAAVSQEATAAA